MIGAIVTVLLALAYFPMAVPRLGYARNQPPSYSQAAEAVQEENRRAAALIQPECASSLLLHGRPTEQVYVLLHGFSNCPAQFQDFGELLFERGANVYLPRLPLHGEKDRMTTALRDLTPEQLIEAVNRAVDLAHGLGRRVTLVGLSVSAAAAAWVAQERSDVERVVLFAPFLAPRGVPEWGVSPLMRLTLRLPNRFLWWDSKNKGEDFHGRAYPRFPTHAVAQMMRIGEVVLARSAQSPPACKKVLLVLTEVDETASLPLASLATQWERNRPGSVETFEFPAAEDINHDFIDPSHPHQRTEHVYPKLLSLLAE